MSPLPLACPPSFLPWKEAWFPPSPRRPRYGDALPLSPEYATSVQYLISSGSRLPTVVLRREKFPSLPPASEGWGKVMFSVCSHLGGGGSGPAGRGGSGPARGGGGISSSWPGGGGSGPARGGGGQDLAPSCGRYASCVHAGGLSCFY